MSKAALLFFFTALVVSGSAHSRTTERVALTLSDGTEHSGVFSVPERTRARLPVIIVLGGFETGEKVVGLMRDELDVIYATTDYPYKAPDRRSFVGDIKELPSIRRAVHRTDLALDALIEKLRHDPRVDLERISVVGASFGAPFAITGAVRNSEIDGVILIHAFGRVDAAITRQLVNEWGSWSQPLAWLLGRWAWWYLDYEAPEAEAARLHAHQRVLFIHSEDDDQLPRESIESLKSALTISRARTTIRTNEGGHLGPGKTEMIGALTEMSLEWLKESKLL